MNNVITLVAVAVLALLVTGCVSQGRDGIATPSAAHELSWGERRRLERLSNEGDVDASLRLANHFFLGLRYDPVKAVRWFRRAALRGSFVAQYSLITLLIDDPKVHDLVEAAEWFSLVHSNLDPSDAARVESVAYLRKELNQAQERATRTSR